MSTDPTLRDRIRDALLDMPGRLFTRDTHRAHSNEKGEGFAAGCPVCDGDVSAMADAVMAAVQPDPIDPEWLAATRTSLGYGFMIPNAASAALLAEVDRLRAEVADLREVITLKEDAVERLSEQLAKERERRDTAERDRDAARRHRKEDLHAMRLALKAALGIDGDPTWDQVIAAATQTLAQVTFLAEVMAGTVLLGADDAIGMLRALTQHLTETDVIGPDQAQRVNAGLDEQQAKADRLAEQISRVRAKHDPQCGGVCASTPCECEADDLLCGECETPYPCPTIRALDAP